MNRDRQSLLVLGGGGFIGSAFCEWAWQQGFRVTACAYDDRLARPLPDGVIFVTADATDPGEMKRVVAEAKPDAVVFAISQINPRSETKASDTQLLAEMRSILNTLEAMGANGCRRLVYISSAGAVYGAGEGIFREDQACHPRSFYGKLKLETERLIETLAGRMRTHYTILRVSNPYGPGQNPLGTQGVIPIFMRRILNGEPIEILGSDQASKDYLYIDDLAEVIGRAVMQCDNRIYNIGSGEGTTLAQIIERIEAACGRRAEKIFRPLPEQEVPSFAIDTRQAAERLGWRPMIGLEEGIGRLHAWMTR